MIIKQHYGKSVERLMIAIEKNICFTINGYFYKMYFILEISGVDDVNKTIDILPEYLPFKYR